MATDVMEVAEVDMEVVMVVDMEVMVEEMDMEVTRITNMFCIIFIINYKNVFQTFPERL